MRLQTHCCGHRSNAQCCFNPSSCINPSSCSRVYDALENAPRAVKWYRAALQADSFNYEVGLHAVQRFCCELWSVSAVNCGRVVQANPFNYEVGRLLPAAGAETFILLPYGLRCHGALVRPLFSSRTPPVHTSFLVTAGLPGARWRPQAEQRRGAGADRGAGHPAAAREFQSTQLCPLRFCWVLVRVVLASGAAARFPAGVLLLPILTRPTHSSLHLCCPAGLAPAAAHPDSTLPPPAHSSIPPCNHTGLAQAAVHPDSTLPPPAHCFIPRIPSPLFSVPQGWLKLLYTSRCKMYEQGGSIEATLAALEAEPATAAQQQQQQQQQVGASAGGAAQPATQQQQQQQQGGSSSGGLQTPGKAAAGAAAAAASGPQPMALSPLPAGAPSGTGGWGLGDNLDVIACRADWLYHRWAWGCWFFEQCAGALMPECLGRNLHCIFLICKCTFGLTCRGAHAECYALTAAALERDPYAAACLPAHLASALELRKKNELFLRGHK